MRRILVESAWHYRRQPRMSKAIRARNDKVSAAVRAIAWKAQQRLHKRLFRLTGKGKPAPHRPTQREHPTSETAITPDCGL